MTSTLFFTIGALLNTKNQFDLGLFLTLLVPYCLGVPIGLAWHRSFRHTTSHTETDAWLTKVVAYALAAVGLGLVAWAFAVGPRAEGDD